MEKAIRKHIRSLIKEVLGISLVCPLIKITDEIRDEVLKFNSEEDLLRSGGISIEALDRAAFGFTGDDIKELMPNQLNIKWKDDWENVKWEQNKSGLTTRAYSSKISLEEPIDVIFEKGKFWIDDGHHRYFAAKTLNKPLKVNLEIKQNPIIELSPDLSYDDFHRCVYRQVKSKLNESKYDSDLDVKKMYCWYSSFKNRYYKDLETAQNDVKHVVYHNNKQFGKIFGEDNPNDIINLFNFVETKKGIKIEPKLKQKKEKKPDLEYNTDTDLVNKQKYLWSDTRGIEIGRYLSKLKYIDTNDSRIYGTEKQEEQNILNIMKKLKSGDELPPILLDYDFGILDGHHRWEAAKRLKIKKIPVIIYENPNENKEQINEEIEKYLTVYHGTQPKFVDSIKNNGLIDKTGYNQCWYMVSTDFDSALFHSNPEIKGGDVYVVKFKVPLKDNKYWDGYPYLWKGEKRNNNSIWFALMKRIPKNFIKKIHKINYQDWIKQKEVGF